MFSNNLKDNSEIEINTVKVGSVKNLNSKASENLMSDSDKNLTLNLK